MTTLVDPRPKLVTGGLLYPIGDECYAVAVARGVEVSERHSGQFWIGFDGPGSVVQIFVDSHGGRKSTFTLTKDAASNPVGVQVFVDGQLMNIGCDDVATRRLYRGDSVNVDWSPMLDDMA